MNDPIFLSLDEILEIHEGQINQYGGHPGILNLELLESAVEVPTANFGGEYLYADVFEMAAAYLFHIIKNHPFVDGNKRTAALTAYVFLKLNGINLTANENDYENIVLAIAESKVDKAAITLFFRDNAVPLSE